jgi:hypothetical protein
VGEVVAKLSAVPYEPDQHLVEAIEKLLAEVKSGEVLGVAFCAHLKGDGIATQVTRGPYANLWMLLGACRELDKRILEMTERL